ncbi:MAG: AAA family ATPase, partial [Anaerolineaceae bacterium]
MQILSTKLMLPPLRSRLVVRPRLFQKLDQGLDCGFILLSAPAGYGKSTLLNAWLNQRDLPAVWYTLDDGDNDPARFLAYLLSGLCEIAPSISEFADGMQPSLPSEAGLIPVVNRLAQVEKPFLLVLDDFHVIQNQAVHQTVRFLLEHRPVSLRLAIATRADPPLALSRLRAGSEMVEIRQADLQFKPDEAVDFFSTTMGLCLPDEAV